MFSDWAVMAALPSTIFSILLTIRLRFMSSAGQTTCLVMRKCRSVAPNVGTADSTRRVSWDHGWGMGWPRLGRLLAWLCDIMTPFFSASAAPIAVSTTDLPHWNDLAQRAHMLYQLFAPTGRWWPGREGSLDRREERHRARLSGA